MKTETPGFYPAARGAWEPNWGVIEKYISFVYKLKQPKALCCCSRNGLGKQVILLGLTQEPHLKNYRFSVTWYGDHHTRRGKLTGSLDLSEDDLLNLRVGYAIQYGRHRGQGVPSGFLAPTSAIQTQCWGGVTPRYIWLQSGHVCDVAITRKVSQTQANLWTLLQPPLILCVSWESETPFTNEKGCCRESERHSLS